MTTKKTPIQKEDEFITALEWWNNLKCDDRNSILVRLYKRRHRK